MKWTCKPRRGIVHLARYVLEDVDHGLFEHTHPMYRRLNAAEKRELDALWQWLQAQEQRNHAAAPGSVAPLAARAVAPKERPRALGPTLFGDEPDQPTQPIDEPAHAAP